MPSCDASDVQVKNFSPPFRRARETRTDAVHPGFCQAEENGDERCPEGWCRCSGELRKHVETRLKPWGSPDGKPVKNKPPKMAKPELDAALGAAKERRNAMRGELVDALKTLVDKGTKHAGALAADEAERIRELEEWLAILKAE